jgi:hypothetical protein
MFLPNSNTVTSWAITDSSLQPNLKFSEGESFVVQEVNALAKKASLSTNVEMNGAKGVKKSQLIFLVIW